MSGTTGADAKAPRIVNVINFIREIEPRSSKPDRLAGVLYETTVKEIDVLKRHGLPGSFLIQYDAMRVERYQRLLKERLDPKRDEIGAWLEIVQPLVEKAGLTWRGRYPWDWHSHVGFSIGYTPAERERLIDVFMEDFKAVFGAYPRSVGSWLIDAHTLGYLADRYGIVASCNCKDQWGTDGYTLWGGYWNQAYYPSRKNMFMPAQDAANQIPVPIFRMLGSDPIYQYDVSLGSGSQSVVSLEPAYKDGGGSPTWVRWFFDFTVNAPCLALAYAQVGQENAFTWAKIDKGYSDQIALLAELAKAGKVRVETLADSGTWFRDRFKITPATAVTVMKDWKGQGRKTVWYNSRFYRANMLWEGERFRIRDVHLFDEDYAERYLTRPVTSANCTYDTLPVVDGYLWSTKDVLAGIRLVKMEPGGGFSEMTGGEPVVEELNATDLQVTWPVKGGGRLVVGCESDAMSFSLAGGGADGWAMALGWAAEKKSTIRAVEDREIRFEREGFGYRLRCGAGRFSREAGKPMVLILPEGGRVELNLNCGG
ncbi:MAG: hypothetical protein JXQ73_10535 [Phycisphaerae bacterium]|nr:hypothetical protein [Phycisphaerae bacterium]